MPINWASPPPLQTTHPLDRLAAAKRRASEAETRVTDPETGAQKGRKPQEYALIPVDALASIAEVYGYGAMKYTTYGDCTCATPNIPPQHAPGCGALKVVSEGKNNWRKGYAWSLSYSALQRHLNAFWGGEETDPESGLPHLAHAGFHILSLLTFASGEQYAAKDDRA